MKPHVTNTNNPVDFPKIENTKNERIRELAEQAGSTHKQNLGVYQFYKSELEEFAQSIIEECIDIVSDGGEFASRPKLVEKLKTHFGIKNE